MEEGLTFAGDEGRFGCVKLFRLLLELGLGFGFPRTNFKINRYSYK